MSNATDRLGEITGVLLVSIGQQPPKLRPRPRPQTAFDRVRREIREERHRSLVARLLPNRHKTGTEGRP